MTAATPPAIRLARAGWVPCTVPLIGSGAWWPSQEVWLYIEPAFEGQTTENRVQVSAAGGRGDALSMTGTEFWTAPGKDTYAAEARLTTRRSVPWKWIGAGLGAGLLLVVAMGVVLAASRSLRRKRAPEAGPTRD